MLSRDRRLFLLRWLKDPRGIGAVAPSSNRLARAMAAQLSKLRPEEYVLELGPGTGVVTKAILAAGLAADRLVVIERDGGFMDKLRAEFPGTLLYQEDACNLRKILEQHGIRQVAAVVSSLPLLSLPNQVRHTVIREAFQVIKPGGVFIQFTYGLHSPVPKNLQRDIGIKGSVAKRIWRNFPPARVWRYIAEVQAA